MYLRHDSEVCLKRWKLPYIPLYIYLCEKNVSFMMVETFSCLFSLERACVLRLFSCVWLCETPWTVACQIPLPMGFSRQVYWNGVPCPPPGDLPDPGIEHTSLTSPALAGGFFNTGTTWVARQAPLSMGILQASILVWVAMSSSKGASQPRNRTGLLHLQVNSLPAEVPGKGVLNFRTG